jgi:WD40 repeat protein
MLVLEFGRKDKIKHLAFAPSGRALVATSESDVRFWRAISDGARAELVNSPRLPHRAVFVEGDKALLIFNFGLRRVDLATSAIVPLAADDLDRYPRFHLSPDGRFILVVAYVDIADVFTLYPANDLTAGAQLWQRVMRGKNYSSPHFLADGSRIVRREGNWNGGYTDQHIVTYDAATGEPIARSPIIRDLAIRTEAAPDGRWVVGLCDTWLYYWPVTAESGTAGSIKNDTKKHFTDAAFHPSGKYLAVTSNDTTVKLYDTTNWEVTRTLTWAVGQMRSVCFSPDGTLAAAGSDQGKVVVWDVDL